jgi:pimeloyl-ACP methyl ester carboxylesterase
MSVDTSPTQTSNTHELPSARRVVSAALVIAGALAAGIVSALTLTMVVFPGATETVITGSILSAFGLGWALMAWLSARFTTQPQRWARVPAVYLGVSGLGLVVFSPQNATLTALNWLWPPVTLALAVWMFRQMRRTLHGRGRWLLTPVVVVLAATAVGATYANVAEVRIHNSYPALGKLYDVDGGRRLHIYCEGDGGPTVVLFNGLGEISATWARILDQVSPTTRVCAYDRAGQGWSDDVGSPQDGVTAAKDLHALLAAAGEHGPYILAGHSIGGPYALTYAALYPEQVAGMLLLDSSSPEQMDSIPSYAGQYAMMRRGLALLPSLTRIGFGSMFSSGSGLSGDELDRAQAMTSTARATRNGRDEISMVPTVFRQAQALTSLHGRPLVVLTTSESLGTGGWEAAQDKLAALSNDSLHRDVQSTHAGLITDEQPAAESAHAIEQVIAAVRTGAPLR